MDDRQYKMPQGNCIISEEVIATIANTAALEVPGVAGMASRLPELRNLINAGATKSVGVINNENETVVDVYVNLKVGVRIPDVAGAIQRQVKNAVQSMTGKPVTKVNVHVEGIVLEDKSTAETAQEQQ
jgi:uncharacterized alkaline shock family protein YloU